MFRRIQNEKGFTLIELLIVIVVLGILAAIVIPNYTGLRDKAYHVEAESAGRAIALALEMYKVETGNYPEGNYPDGQIDVETIVAGYVSNYAQIMEGKTLTYEGTPEGYTVTVKFEKPRDHISAVFQTGGVVKTDTDTDSD